MGYLFARQQLYELVWSEPMTTLAKSLGISGVGLAKACRRGDIPVPPRGYWARLAAGQRVARTPLPRRAPGMLPGDRRHSSRRVMEIPLAMSPLTTA